MTSRRRASAPALATYYSNGESPTFDPSEWERNTLDARWEAWFDTWM